MPTILLINVYRFFFYSNEHLPKHIHIEKAEKTAKFNIDFIELIKSRQLTTSELREVKRIIEQNQQFFIQKWDEFFNSK